MHEQERAISHDITEIPPQEQVIQSTLLDLANSLYVKGDTSAIVMRRSAMENSDNDDWYALFYGERGDGGYFGVQVKYPRTQKAEISVVADGKWVSLEHYADMVHRSPQPRTDALAFFFRSGWEKRPIEEKIKFAAALHTVGKMKWFSYFDGYDTREVPLARALHRRRLFEPVEIPS